MSDYRLKRNRLAYFNGLYDTHLEYKVHPGLVYLYIPELAYRLKWTDEQQLWFCFINGMTQNPITSLVIFNRVPEPTTKLKSFTTWFNNNWEHLQFDTDRRYAKKLTPTAMEYYAARGGILPYLPTESFTKLWNFAESIPSFGRLSAFSYLEYVYLSGFGADCDSLMFDDRSGSRSHRNGMLMLLGKDELVDDKRIDNDFSDYKDFSKLCQTLDAAADDILKRNTHAHAGKFTLESALCAFKNSFFGRRYVGVYADMAWERILWAEAHGHDAKIFRQMREELLPHWLRCEVTNDGMTIKQRAAVFPRTGVPYRAEHFL
jgi:hypothetical protein